MDGEGYMLQGYTSQIETHMCVLCYFTYDAKVSPLSLLNTLKTLYVFTALLYMALVARLHFYLWQEGRMFTFVV